MSSLCLNLLKKGTLLGRVENQGVRTFLCPVNHILNLHLPFIVRNNEALEFSFACPLLPKLNFPHCLSQVHKLNVAFIYFPALSHTSKYSELLLPSTQTDNILLHQHYNIPPAHRYLLGLSRYSIPRE